MQYTNVFTIPAYKIRVNNLKSELDNALSGDFYNNAVNRLKSQLDKMKEQERKMFALFPDKIKNIDDLNRVTQQLSNNIVNFSGEAMYMQFQRAFEEAVSADKAEFEASVLDFIYNTSEGQSIAQAVAKRNLPEVLKQINQIVGAKSKGAKFTSIKGLNGAIVPLKFTNEQKAGWTRFLRSRGLYGNTTLTASGNNPIFTWKNAITFGDELLTGNRVKELIANKQFSQTQLDKINNTISDYICSQTKDPAGIKKIIDYVLSKNDTRFFIGKNTQDIAGLLGEIAGLYYMSEIFGIELSTINDDKVYWAANVFQDGKQPSVDIVLRELFGIQVKNTADELIGPINFLNHLDFSTLLARLGSDLPIDIAELIGTYGATLKFNVPYKRKRQNGRTVYMALNNDTPNRRCAQFIKYYKTLQSYNTLVNRLLTLFIASIIHIEVSDAIQGMNTKFNSLFLLRTKVFVTASQIMHDVITNIGNELYKLQVSFSLKDDDNTIVNYLNMHDASNRRNESSGERKTASQLILDSLVISTSFNFRPYDKIYH